MRKRKIIVRISGREKKGKTVRRCGKLWNLEKKISKWTGLFSVNGLGLNFCGIFEEKKLSFGFWKNRQQPKAVKRLVKYEN